MQRISRLMMSARISRWQVLLGVTMVSGFLGCGPGSSTITTPTPEPADTRVSSLTIECDYSEVESHYQWYFNAVIEDDQGWQDILIVRLAIPGPDSVLIYDSELDDNGNNSGLQSYWYSDPLLSFVDEIDCTECALQTYRIRAQDEEDVQRGTYVERVFRGEDVCKKYVQ